MKILKIGSLIVLLLALSVGYWAVFGHFSEGNRAGTVIKLSKQGYIFKTYEGQLDLGGFNRETGGSTWEFSVTDEQVIADLEKAMNSGKRVKLHYKEKFFVIFYEGKTKYIVDKVDFLGTDK
jgi:hypothetical protein